ncbi:MAG TPA: 2-oxo-4-hydroxy-4-carboxy-5-ureidoimidazoline decarboxylase [Steroidobacteraceae bacterium]|nr:2-oxo-4-hydroxy-4-carboxy-5-ureidoimidazoline decarboxylase [Steroidobacteraceae bacterium]
MIRLEELNGMDAAGFTAALGGIFEHSPWVASAVADQRPFASVVALHAALCAAVDAAGDAAQTTLIRAHPELASKAAIAGELTAESSREQRGAGLKSCTPQQYERLQTLNREYAAHFGFPFIIAVKGHTPETIIDSMISRLGNALEDEKRMALRQIGRIALFRLEELIADDAGNEIMVRADALARHTDDATGLTCACFTPAHRATALQIRDYMLAAGLEVTIDAVGNVVGRCRGDVHPDRTLITGSHYDTVADAGRYDGRLGVLLPITVLAALRRGRISLPYSVEVIAFSDEEGLRFHSTFLGSSAVAGCFDPQLLTAADADGQTLHEVLRDAGNDPAQIPSLARKPSATLGFIEVHIEQGPVLLDAAQALGVVTGIAGARRLLLQVKGLAGHAGTVPMALRRDAAAGAAEIVLQVEAICRAMPGVVGTVGQLHVPHGAVNVIPGQCSLSIDVRSADDTLRSQALMRIDDAIAEIMQRRRLEADSQVVMDTPATTCAPHLRELLAASVTRTTGAAAMRLPSGAGHDAIMMSRLTDVAMLFVRCGNGGISHHPDEILAAADASLAAAAFRDFLLNFKVDG